MDASVLVVGCHSFLAILLEPICCLANFTVEVALDPDEATPLIQAQQPDLLILQARRTGSLDLCRQVKAQNRLAWIYCLVIDDHGCFATDSPDNRHLEVERWVTALEAGADDYLCLNLISPCQVDHPLQLTQEQRCLLYAQIQAGIRRVYNYRELMRTNDLLSAIALSDPLTELNNRRAFEWELPRQIRNARQRGMPISLLMLDVDHFKNINDQHGHLVGDRALQLIAARLRHNLRFYDTPFRYGGEEFVIILSDTGCQEAAAIAHRLCQLIANQPFVIDENLDLHITISAGTASLLNEDDPKGVSLLYRADQNLLKAKSLGRNRVISSQEHRRCEDS